MATLPVYDPTTGAQPQIGQKVLVSTSVNGKNEIYTIDWAGNLPQGHQFVSKDNLTSLGNSNLSQYDDRVSRALGGGVYDTASPDTKAAIDKINAEKTAYQGQLTEYGKFFGTSAPVSDLYSKFLPNAPTTSAQYYTPEFVASETQKNGFAPFSGDAEKQTWLKEMQARGINIDPNTLKTSDNLVEIAPGKFVPKDSAAAKNQGPQADPNAPANGGAPGAGAAQLPQITSNLALNSSGAEVAALQQWLLAQGYSIPSLQNGKAKPGFYGPETQAAVTQWQKDQEAKGNLKVPNPSDYGSFGPLSRQAMTAGGGAAKPPGGTGGGQLGDGGLQATVDQLRSLYGLPKADSSKSLVQQAIDDYQSVYTALGIPSIKQSYTDAVNEFSRISTELNDKIAGVRDDPWLSQGIADARIKKLQDNYDAKLKVATAKMQLFDSLTKEGIAQANDIIGRVHQVQTDNAAVINQAIDIVQKRQDALNELNTSIVEVNGRKLLIDDKTGNTIKDLGAVTKSTSSSGTGTTVSERNAAALDAYKTAFVPGAKMADGTAILDASGYVTPVAWRAAIADYGGSRDDFIKKYGHYLYMEGGKVSAAYGLTAVEQKLITGV